jgi:hypothetical protein
MIDVGLGVWYAREGRRVEEKITTRITKDVYYVQFRAGCERLTF